MRVHVLALNGVFDTGLASILDAFTCANELCGLGLIEAEPFEVQTIGVRQRVRSGQGARIPVARAEDVSQPGLVIVPALAAKMPDTLGVALERPDVRDAIKFLKRWSAEGTVLAAACTGTFVLASSSCLDGLVATTTWWLAPMFRQRFPAVRVDESRMLVPHIGVVTAGAALGHLDLALWLIRQRSPALAALTARYMLVDDRPSQAAFVIPDHLLHTDPLLERFEHWVRPRLKTGFSMPQAAQAIGTSERTLARRFRQVLGKTPVAFVQDLRVEQAVRLLQTGHASVDQIAEQVGYADGVTLRALLRRKLRHGVRELRGKA